MMLPLLFLLLTQPPETVVYAAGYIPNVQFAPFYVALSRGYYREEGIDLKMDYTIGPDVLKLVALGRVQIGSVDPDAFIHAAVRDLPLVHIATLYQSYPIALIARDDFLDGAGLKGKRIGISGAYGSSYLGLKAILSEMGLTPADVHITAIGFTQVAALKQERVDAVVGYINNEPLRLKALGVEVHLRTLSKRNGIPGVGLMTGRKFFQEKKPLLYGFLRATFRGMHDVISDPKTCYRLVVDNYLPELSAKDRYDAEYRILTATLPFWQSAYVAENGYGQCDPRAWENLGEHMLREQKIKDYANWGKWVDLEFTWKPSP